MKSFSSSQPKDQAIEASQGKSVKAAPGKKDSQRQPSILRQLREQRNLSQRELARKMGVSRIQLQWMENKHPERLLLREVKLMAGALQYSLPAFMKIMGFVSLRIVPNKKTWACSLHLYRIAV